MHSDTLKAYRELRAKYPTASASMLIRWVKDAAASSSDVWEWDWHGDTATLEGGRDGFDIALKVEPDCDPDISYLGTFTDSWQDGALHATDGTDRNRYAFFIPTYSIEEHRRDLSRLGYARHHAYELARSYVLRDMKTAENYESWIVIVTASREGIELAWDSLGGIDVGDIDRDTQMESIIIDHAMVDNVVSEARATIERLVSND